MKHRGVSVVEKGLEIAAAMYDAKERDGRMRLEDSLTVQTWWRSSHGKTLGIGSGSFWEVRHPS
ncbi:MAG: hypothetical protein ABSH52_28625 [Terriglobia bacterium]|jgi:hypothetical protein